MSLLKAFQKQKRVSHKQQQVVPCPLCECGVKLRDVNQHMDSGCVDNIASDRAEAEYYEDDGDNVARDIRESLEEDATTGVSPSVTGGSCSVNTDETTVREDTNTLGATVEGRAGREAYYLTNFNHALTSILEHEQFKELFNEEDHTILEMYNNLTVDSQKLYVRLFGRKYSWITFEKINYQEIADISSCLTELVQAGLLLDEQVLHDLEAALMLLSSSKMKALSKLLRISIGGQRKQEQVETVLAHSRQQGSMMGHVAGLGHQGSTHTILMRVRRLLAPGCYKLSEAGRSLFLRVLLLFSLPQVMEEDEVGRQSLTQLMLVNSGKLTYPHYQVRLEARIYRDREDVVRYQKTKQQYYDLRSHMDSGRWDEAYGLYTQVYDDMEHSAEERHAILGHDQALPPHLRVFSPVSVMYKCLWLGVDVLQRRRCYPEASQVLEVLLAQDTYCSQYRGKWYERLTLNLHQHLKRIDKSLDVIERGLNEAGLKKRYRLSLYQRAQLISQSSSVSEVVKVRVALISPVQYTEARKVVIEGRLFRRQVSGYKNLFITDQCYHGDVGEEELETCGVEQLALEHYKKQGYIEGVHGEGSVFTTLLCLLLWDVMFDDTIPDVFISPFQSAPLDLHYPSFYTRRRGRVEERLAWLQAASPQVIHEELEERWRRCHGQQCMGLGWERFRDVAHAQGLVSSLGPEGLTAILSRLVREGAWSGFPDLTVWSPGRVKIVEVKGPGDKLSVKQTLWLDYLHQHHIPCEVCHVKAVSSKRLKVSRKT